MEVFDRISRWVWMWNQASGGQPGQRPRASGPAHSEPLAHVLVTRTSPWGIRRSVAALWSSAVVLIIPGFIVRVISCFSRIACAVSLQSCQAPLSGILAEAMRHRPSRTSVYITKHYFPDLILSLLFLEGGVVFCKDCLMQKVKVSAKQRPIFAE